MQVLIIHLLGACSLAAVCPLQEGDSSAVSGSQWSLLGVCQSSSAQSVPKSLRTEVFAVTPWRTER